MKKIGLITQLALWTVAGALTAQGQDVESELQDYFIDQTQRITDRCLAQTQSWEDWIARKSELRAQLREMLGLEPMPDRADLRASVTGSLEEEGFTVEKIQFQSLPGLYVTANLYLPKPRPVSPAPAILYLCGHGRVAQDGISYGNKVAYQHHGAWFARAGYVCLLLDTLQLGEIEGIHHGTYREGMWWWNSRGYTPAGVEAWNGMRALDYLSGRPEVDTNRFGATGRSGGGAYTWWLTALDDRVRVAAPVAGITDLHNHIVDGVVEGHCDCMFMVNTYRWDYWIVAGLAAPRPLLLVNTDHDSIFPLDGVLRIHNRLRQLYELASASDQLGLVIGPGPHKDTQDLQIPVFRWFNKHLKGEESVIDQPALKFSAPEPLKVFTTLPVDQRNTTIQQDFVSQPPPPEPPHQAAAWSAQRDTWMEQLRTKVFRGWPTQSETGPPQVLKETVVREGELEFITRTLISQAHVTLRLYLLRSTRAAPAKVQLNIIDDQGWNEALGALRAGFARALPGESAAESDPLQPRQPRIGQAAEQNFDALRRQVQEGWMVAWFAPRGLGEGAWKLEPKKLIQIRRRFMLLGQTLDGMRVWDIRRAIQSFHESSAPVHLHARGELACDALYAALFEPALASLRLDELPTSHEQGPDYLYVLRVLDIPQAVAMVAENTPVDLSRSAPGSWTYPMRVAHNLGWSSHQLRSE